jgi:arylsulfatase A-like enzyme
MGNRNIQTPNIDRLASEGMRFTQCLAGSAVCAPTRCCLMTGKHSGHTSVRLNGGGTPLRAEEETIASLLKKAGYATGGFGKWGCGGRGSTGVPEKHGFDVFFGYYDQVHAHSYYTPYLLRNSVEVPLKGNHGNSNGETYTHYVIMEEALKFIRENKDQPFFAYLPITPPHGIHDIPDSDPSWQLVKDKDWPEPAKRYAAMVNMVDRNVGEVLALLKELGLDDNTVVFFSGDNGGADYFASKEHPRGIHEANVNPHPAGTASDPLSGTEFKGKKGNLYEGGLRVPYLVRWNGKIAPHGVTNHLCYFPDALPTICDLVGVAPPADVDGISFAPTLLGRKDAQKDHEYLYWELNSWTAIRAGDWKAVRPKPDAAWELYDLSKDIGEQHNLAAEKPDVLRKLVASAEAAHEPVREGSFASTDLHERDRQAKFGFEQGSQKPQPAAGTRAGNRTRQRSND